METSAFIGRPRQPASRSPRPAILFLATFFVLSRGLDCDPLFLLESESPRVSSPFAYQATASGGYEHGYIPDAFARTSFNLGIFKPLQLGLSAPGVFFIDQNSLRLTELELSAKVTLLSKPKLGALSLYAKGTAIFTEPVLISYPGTLGNVGLVISPRADAGNDYGGGIAANLRLFPVKPSTVWLMLDANYARTENRSYYSPFELEGYKNRIFVNAAPALVFGNGKTALSLQNRFTWWFDRGLQYEVLPQFSADLAPGLVGAIGVGIPALGGGVYRAIASISYSGLLRNVNAPHFSVIEEGNNLRIRVYFTFIGDKADLFPPRNKTYGAKNARMLPAIVKIIKQYPDSKIVIEGHANRAKFDLSFADEQKRELMPLSTARAQAVREALIDAGIARSRITVGAYGALKPLASFTDDDVNWKNRRVEILITRKKK